MTRLWNPTAICGGLPLALQITGANLAAHRSKSARQMATSLEETETRLDEMQYGSQSVRAAFDLSYKDLTDEHARLFRLLTVNTGPDISTEAAVVLAGRSQRDTRRRLEALSRAHLIYENTSDRWQMHDLVRLYDEGLSGDNSRADHRAAAEKRLFRYYQTTTRAAIDFLWHGHNPAAGGPFTESSEVVAWLKAEHANLTAAVISSIRSHPSIAVKIAFPLSGFLDQWRYFDEAVIVTENALMAARTLRDVAAEAGMLDNLGIALQNIGRTADALEATREAIKLYRRLADEKPDLYERALGRALANLASRIEASDEQHLTASQEAVDIGRRWATDQDHIGRGVELAGALHNQGMTLSALGSHSLRYRAAAAGHWRILSAVPHTIRTGHVIWAASMPIGFST